MNRSQEFDKTIADIHRIREQISDAFHGDISAISEDARNRQEQSGRRTVSFSEEPLVATPAKKLTAES